MEDPLSESVQYLQLLQQHAADALETHLLAFELYIRKKKLLLALQVSWISGVHAECSCVLLYAWKPFDDHKHFCARVLFWHFLGLNGLFLQVRFCIPFWHPRWIVCGQWMKTTIFFHDCQRVQIYFSGPSAADRVYFTLLHNCRDSWRFETALPSTPTEYLESVRFNK